MRFTHCTVAAALLLFAGAAASGQTAAAHTFHVFLRGNEVGTEEVTLFELADGWTLRGSARFGAPLNLKIEYWEARYDRGWKPLELVENLSANTDKWTVHTAFSGTTAASDVALNGDNQRRNQTIEADSVVLPNLVFGSYEALAARLVTASAGTKLPAYIAPQNPISVAVDRVSPEKIQLPERTIEAKHWTLTFGNADGSIEMDFWTEGSRLLRIDIPSQMLTVIRDDISAVSARVLTLARPNDEQIKVPANGFSVAGTLSKPPNAEGRLPAVVLVSGSGTDRDEFVSGIPIFAQLATSLADAGFIALRYDKRGTGQSGGRPESANYDDYASDAREVIAYLGKRKDVDPRRIAVLGFGEGGWIALNLAAKESRVSALVLVGTAASKGTDLVFEQQRRLFEGTGTTAAAQQKAVEQQNQILQAVITGKGWDALSPEIRRRVDTPLYRSFLMFDPAQAIAHTRQPLLVVQADLDNEVPTSHGEQLAQLARSRIKAAGTDYVHLPGLNHLLARAQTGRVAEYGTLAERNVSPAAVTEISAWLKKTLAAPGPK
ncbi:MAG TPA: alpha/beta hydrolase [Vicinamibacterales bacterium]|nr:alpha/beta hydrolase [Vicinamibacterales bacterium]